MRLILQPQRDQRLTGLISDAGTVFSWFHYLTASGGTAAYGIGPTPIYVTGQLTGIWQQAGQKTQNMGGGQLPFGQEVIYCKECVGTADRLTYGNAVFTVVEEPSPARLFGTMYYKVTLKRG
jgi:hypothetical protein